MKTSLISRFLLPVAVTAASCSLYAQGKRMNLLFIAVDDMNDDLGSFGNTLVKSPNIDRLAKNGVVFANAYCQFPLSSPSRTSLLTGLRPDSTKVFDLVYHFRQDMPDVVTLPQMFMKNEYYVARVGKMFHYGNPGDIGTNGLDDKASWMDRINPAGLDKTSLELDVINYTPEKKGLGAAMAFYSDKKGTDIQHTDGIVATETIRLLKENKDKPFFIAAGFYKPHCPWITPEKYFNLYNMDQMKLPEIDSTTRNNYPALALASTRPWPYLGINTVQARECKLAYYAAISFVDAQIGRLLDAGWKHPAFTQVQRANVPGHSIRTEQYRYTEWNFGKAGAELYDEVNDSQELHNLVNDPNYSKVVRQLQQSLHDIHSRPVSGGKAIPDTRKLFSN